MGLGNGNTNENDVQDDTERDFMLVFSTKNKKLPNSISNHWKNAVKNIVLCYKEVENIIYIY